MKTSRTRLFAVQASLALIVIAAGAAKVVGADVMVQALDGLGLSALSRLIVGTVEMLTGMCLLVPRSTKIGAAALVVFCVGMTVKTAVHAAQWPGHVASADSSGVAPSIHLAIDRSCADAGSAPRHESGLRPGRNI